MKHFVKIVITIAILIVLIGFSYFLYKGYYDKMGTEKPRILVVLKSIDASMEFWQIVKAGIHVAAEEFDVDVDITGPKSESDIDGQIQILEEAIQSKPNVIVMAATDYNVIVPVANKIKKAGIALITIDSGLNSDVSESFIATDNMDAGKKAGAALAEWVGPEASIAIISHVKVSATAIEREQGVKFGLGNDLGNRIEGTYFSNGSQEKAYEITKDLLLRKPYIEGIAGLNEPSTLGAAKAIKELGLSGKVKLVGFDSSIHEVKLIEEGVIQATVIQKPFNMGYLGIKTAVQVLRGEKVKKRIDTGSQVITKENMYSRENQKLLFPFMENE